MKIRYHSPDYLTLFVESETHSYEYERVPEFYVRKLRAMIKAGHEGKAWELLRKFRVVRRVELNHREIKGQMTLGIER